MKKNQTVPNPLTDGPFVRRVHGIGGKTFFDLGATNGGERIADSAKIFTLIDSAFRELGDEIQPTDACQVKVDEMFFRHGSLHEVIHEISAGTGMLSLASMTDGRIIQFVTRYPELLCENGYGTHFVLRRGGAYHVARVSVGLNKTLGIGLFSLESKVRLLGDHGHRFVTPV